MNFNHTHGCQKCLIVGEYHKDVHRMSFSNLHNENRSDDSFRRKIHSAHHKERSILEDLPINMIKDFATSDPLHLLEHGLMKKCFSLWMKGSSYYKKKWKKSSIDEIIKLIYTCNKELPNDIHRSIRILNYISYWKATEFRCFLLYTGIVIFKNYLENEVYEHFLSLCCAVRICSCDQYKEMIPLAKQLFLEYVESFILIYGRNSIVSNVHNLIHICDDVERFGNLNTISTYPFENSLHHIKLKIQKCKAPLEQISRRIAEISQITEEKPINSNLESFAPQLKYHFYIQQTQNIKLKVYKYISLRSNVSFSTKKTGDKWILFVNGDIVEMEYAIYSEKSYFIYGASIKNKRDFFNQPFSSSHLDIYISNGEKNEKMYYNVDRIKSKLMCLSYNNEMIFLPILHSLDEMKK